MPSINSLFINVQTNGIEDVPLNVQTGWGTNGKPAIVVTSSGKLPEGVTMRVTTYPSGAISDTFFDHLVDPSNTNELISYESSGIFTDLRYFNSSGTYIKVFNIPEDYENTIYKVGYYANYFDSDNTIVYNPLTEILSDVYVTNTSLLDPGKLQVTAALTSSEPTTSNININITQDREITNRGLVSPGPYLVSVSGVDGWYTPTGGEATGYDDADNYFNYATSGMLLSLPYISGSQESASVYEIQLRWLNQLAVETDPLIFNTSTIKTSIDDFDDGDLEAFVDVSVKRVTEIPIKNDVLQKKRYSIGIEDLALVNETFKKQGFWISNHYTIDDPIYTFFLKVGETIPALIDIPVYKMVKYYVQFANQDWIRISPINRGDEVDEDGNVVSKFFVLDQLNLGYISTSLLELPYNFPVFSFRIKIEIDMNFLTSKNFISPSIDYYECHITDRNSFLRIK